MIYLLNYGTLPAFMVLLDYQTLWILLPSSNLAMAHPQFFLVDVPMKTSSIRDFQLPGFLMGGWENLLRKLSDLPVDAGMVRPNKRMLADHPKQWII